MKNKIKKTIRNPSNKSKLEFKGIESKADKSNTKFILHKDYVDKRVGEGEVLSDKRREQRYQLDEAKIFDKSYSNRGLREDVLKDSINVDLRRKGNTSKVFSNKDIRKNENLGKNLISDDVGERYVDKDSSSYTISENGISNKDKHRLNKTRLVQYNKKNKSLDNTKYYEVLNNTSASKISEVVQNEKINEENLENDAVASKNNDEKNLTNEPYTNQRKKRRNYHYNEVFTRSNTKTKDEKDSILKDTLGQRAEKIKTSLNKDLDKEHIGNEAKDKIRTHKKSYKKSKTSIDKEKKRVDYSKKLFKTKDKIKEKMSKSSLMFANYLESGSSENVGIEGSEKSLRAYSSLMMKRKRYRNESIRKLKRRDRKSKLKLEKSLKLREANKKYLDEVKKLTLSKEYQKKNAFKKFLKRRKMKKTIYSKENLGTINRLKKVAKNTLSSSVKLIGTRAKSMGLVLGGVLFLVMLIFNIGSSVGTILNATNTSVLTTSYLSDRDVLENVNNEYSALEYNLQDEIDSVRKNHPGYDEYVIRADKIGHDSHVLLAYLTARYGVFEEVKDMRGNLLELFNDVYSLKYDEEIEIRYRTEYESYEDEEGNYYTRRYRVPYEYKKLIVNLRKKDMDSIVRDKFKAYEDNLWHYETLLQSKGNMEVYFGSNNPGEVLDNKAFKNPGIEFSDIEVKTLFNEAEKHIGERYVFGANGPTNLDCSSFVCYSFTHSGIKNMPRTTAWGIYNSYTRPISPSEARAGDIIFFKNTYNSGSPISHVGIYAGNGMMIHAGDPIQFTNINTPYWREHFYGFGRAR